MEHYYNWPYSGIPSHSKVPEPFYLLARKGEDVKKSRDIVLVAGQVTDSGREGCTVGWFLPMVSNLGREV